MALISSTNTPIFVQNQILRADDLNDLVNYLENQIRLTRIFTVGIGLLSGDGLNPTLQTPTPPDNNQELPYGIKISSGQGISSEGILFELGSDCVFTHYKEEVISKNALSCSDEGRSSCNDLDDPETVYELFTSEVDGSSEIMNIPLNSEHLLIFLYCENTVQRNNCFNECEQTGADRSTSIRVILFPKPTDDPSPTIPPTDAENNPGTFEVSLNDPPFLRRFGFDADNGGLNLAAIRSWEELYGAYLNAIGEGLYEDPDTDPNPPLIGLLALIAKACTKMYNNYYIRLPESSDKDFEDLAEMLNKLHTYYADNTPEESDIQYYYAFVRDLILAYKEFHSVACGMIAGTSSSSAALSKDKCEFPGHIVLGVVNKPSGTLVVDDSCRTPFFPASATEGQNERQKKAKILYLRMVNMLAFLTNAEGEKYLDLNLQATNDPTSPTDIRITGSCTQKTGLSKQAIPRYLKYDNVQENWTTDNVDCNETVLRTHYDLSDFPNNALLYEVDTFNFYRIEGHLNKPPLAAAEEIKTAQKKANVAFDIREVALNPGADIVLADMRAERSLYFGQIQEVYQNTRADLLCKLEEVRDAGGNTPFPDNPDEALDIFQECLIDNPELDSIVPTSVNLDPQPAPGGNANSDALMLAQIEAFQFFIKMKAAIDSFTNGNSPNINDNLTEALIYGQSLLIQLAKRYINVLQDIYKSLAFHTFAECHPGLEHLGGVHQGGTFVLVYAYKFIDEATRQVYLGLYGNPDDDGVYEFNTDTELIAAAWNDADPPEEFNLADDIEKKIVADFCLPYMCCSEGAHIRNELVAPNLRILLDGLYCVSDTVGATVSFAPSGGTVRFEGNVFPDNEIINAAPTLTIPYSILDFVNGRAVVTVKYDVDGQVVTKSTTIYKKPNTDFSCQLNGPFFSDDDNCQLLGYRYDIKLNTPMPLNEVSDVVFNYGAEGKLIIKSGDVVTNDPNVLINNNVFESISLNVPMAVFGADGNIEFSLDAENTPDCLSSATCDGEVTHENSIVPFNICEVDGDTVKCEEVNDGDKFNVNITGDDSGFLEIYPKISNGIFNTQLEDGSATDTTVIVVTPKDADGNAICEKARYFLIYDSEAVNAFVANDVNPVYTEIFSSVRIPDVAPVPGQVVVVTYTLNCPGQTLSGSFNFVAIGLSAKKAAAKSRKVAKTKTRKANPGLTKSAAKLFDTRTEAQLAALTKLADTDPTLDKLKTFSSALNFVKAPANSVTAVNASFEVIIKSLSASLSRTKGQRKKDLLKVTKFVMHNYLDKLLVVSPLNLDAAAAEILSEYLPKLKKRGLSTAVTARSWDGQTLGKALKAKIVDEIMNLF